MWSICLRSSTRSCKVYSKIFKPGHYNAGINVSQMGLLPSTGSARVTKTCSLNKCAITNQILEWMQTGPCLQPVTVNLCVIVFVEQLRCRNVMLNKFSIILSEEYIYVGYHYFIFPKQEWKMSEQILNPDLKEVILSQEHEFSIFWTNFYHSTNQCLPVSLHTDALLKVIAYFTGAYPIICCNRREKCARNFIIIRENYVALRYEEQWWIGLVTKFSEQEQDVKVIFL